MRRPTTRTLATRTSVTRTLALAAIASLGLSPAATDRPATPGQSQGITRVTLARGTAGASYAVAGAAGSDVVVQGVKIEPGGSSGWHTHPGSEVAVVRTGTLTLLDGDDPNCAATTLRAGEVFVGSGHPHMGRNTGSEQVQLVVTYVDVPGGQAASTPVEPPPQCAGK